MACSHCEEHAPVGATGHDRALPFLDRRNLKTLLLCPQGRLNRARYWAAFGLLLAGGLVAAMILPALGLLFWFCALYPHVVIGIKRLHDLDKTGHWMWLTLVPLFNLYVAFLILCVPGTKGANVYGEDPLL
ncbi:MAG: DUF805 domain-containing protein [Proteobacteria bacterium]|nr:DUF805 domain-containing protein [Pseudomonadota bacterium]